MKHASQIIALLATLLLTACATSEVVPDEPAPEDAETALSFTAYVARDARTLATEHDIADVTALSQVGGFGVFAYAQGQQLYDDYSLGVAYPNFFVNQQVWNATQDGQDGHKGADVTATGEWKYEPVKYYDNNPGARHSFFAYAPYDKDADMVFTTGKAPQLRYDVAKDLDLLWSEPAKDLLKPATDTHVAFNFAHALTKTTFHVAPFVDEVHSDGNHATDDHPISIVLPDGTTVKVRSIHLNGNIPYTGLLSTGDGTWTPSRTAQYYNIPGADAASWTGDGSTVLNHYHHLPTNKLIPTQKVSIEVIYDVISAKGDINEHVTRKAVSQETFDLDRGKAYNIYLDLGLTTVKFFATVGGWGDDSQTVVLPDEEEHPIFIETVVSTIIDWQAGVSDNPVW